MKRVKTALSRQGPVARERVRHQLEQREQRGERVHRPERMASPERDQETFGRIPRLDEAAQREDRENREHQQWVEEAHDLPRQRVEDQELRERGPEDPGALGQEPPGHAELEHEHVGAREDDPDAGERPHRSIEAGARYPFPVELERAGPEIEERDQHAQRIALAGDQQVRESREEPHVMLVHAQAVIEQHDAELEEIHQDEAGVGPGHQPPRGEEQPGADRGGEVCAQQQRHARGRQHAQLLALEHQRPADRLGLRVDECHDPLIDPVQIGDDVQEGQRHAVPAERGIALDLGDLRAQEPEGRRHGGSLAYARRQDKSGRQLEVSRVIDLSFRRG